MSYGPLTLVRAGRGGQTCAMPAQLRAIVAVLACAAAAASAASRKAYGAERQVVYAPCSSSDPTCIQAEVVALRKHLNTISRELFSLANSQVSVGSQVGARVE